MNDTQNLFNPCEEHLYAILSKLAYEDLKVGDLKSFNSTDFSHAEINFLKQYYKVVNTSISSPEYKSGFRGFFIENKDTKKTTFIIRGTVFLEGDDLDDDMDIDLRGMATQQFIEAYNYYVKTTTSVASTSYIIRYSSHKPETFPYLAEGGITGGYYFLEPYQGTATEVPNITTIAGHSLGGHLAGLISMITGKQAYIYNAPSFKEKLATDIDFRYVTSDTTERVSSEFVGFINRLFGIDSSQQQNILHIYNTSGKEIIANFGKNWINNKEICCFYNGINPLEYHGIGGICASYYAYEQLKDLMTGANCFFGNNSLTTFHDAFENLFKLYCLFQKIPYYDLDYSNHIFIMSLTDVIKQWADSCREANITITADSFNQSTSLPVNGTFGKDIVYTGGGTDTVNSSAGNDIVYGGDFFNDNADPKSSRTVDLGAGDDEYHATTGNDFVYAGEGNDYIATGAGNDTVDTRRNARKKDTNTVFLGAGSDTFIGGCATDIVDGGVADDTEDDTNTVELGEGEDQYKGGAGNDIVYGGPDRDFINAAAGDDRLFGDKGNDQIFATSGHNVISGGSGKDYIIGGSEVDEINGDENDDEIYGGDGNDIIKGGAGDDVIYGGEGNDKIWTGSGRDFVNAGSGINHIYRNDDNNAKGFYIGGTGTDHIYGAKNLDRIFISTSYASYQPEGRNLVITLPSGKTAILHNFFRPDKQNTGGNSSHPYAAGAPFVITPDRHIHGYSVIAGGYVYTGQDLPEKEMPDPKDGDQVPPIPDEPQMPGGGQEDPGDDTPDNDDKKQDEPLIPWDPFKGKPFSGSLLDWDALYPSLPLDALRDLFRQAETTRSPLILDLDGSGLETLPANSDIYFDHDGNGFAEKTGWAAPHEGILVRDLNSNGQIDDGTELFGDSTVLSDGHKAANGFEALKELDSDNNGVFDNNDAAWNEVKVWKDTNSNARVDDGELLTLEEAGVQSIDLNYRSGGKP